MLLNILKPKGMTSHDVVDFVRRILEQKPAVAVLGRATPTKARYGGRRRVGHAGTLDPFATGVLVVGVGREDTKKLSVITKNTEKEYIATLELGKTSSTGDPEGVIKPTITNLAKISFPRLSRVKDVLKEFKGEIEQTPPAYSAIKLKGIPAYKLARRGKSVKLPQRKVRIYELKLLSYEPPFLKIRVVCSAGTYIRSLAEDIGKKLGTGAYLIELERIRVGDFKIENSVPLAKLNPI